MRNIKIEQIMEKSYEIQNVFRKWWKPQIGDLYYLYFVTTNDLWLVNNDNPMLLDENEKLESLAFPALTLHQLIEFIEDKTDTKVEFRYYNNSYTIEVGYSDDFKTEYWGTYEDLGDNLLDAFWIAACDVAEADTKTKSTLAK